MAPGDTGQLKLSVVNEREIPVTGVTIPVESDSSFRLESGSDVGPVSIPARGGKIFTIRYSVPADAPEGLAVIPFFPSAGSPLDLEPQFQLANFLVDATSPTLSFIQEDGGALLNELGQVVVDGATIDAVKVIVRADDTGGSGIARVTITGPAPFDPTTFSGGAVEQKAFDGLVDGGYTVTFVDRAGNEGSISFIISADHYAPLLRVRKDNENGELLGEGSETDSQTLHIRAEDIVLGVSPNQSGLARVSVIGLDPHNEFENYIEYEGEEAVSFSTTLPLGYYWIVAEDRAGNMGEKTIGIVSSTGPIATLYIPGYRYLYHDFRGFSASTPSIMSQYNRYAEYDPVTGEPTMQGFMNYTARAAIVGDSAPSPISRVRVTGVDLDFNYVSDLAPPQAELGVSDMGDLSAGTYHVTMTDIADGVTFMPFKVVDLKAYLCGDANSTFISSSVFSISNFVCLKSSLGLKSIQEAMPDPPGTLIGGEIPLNGVDALHYPLSATVGAPLRRSFTVADIESNAGTFVVMASPAIESLGGASNVSGTMSLASEPIDVKALGLQVPSARLISAAYTASYSEEIVHGVPIDNSPQTIANVSIFHEGVLVAQEAIVWGGEPSTSPFYTGGNRTVGRFPTMTATMSKSVRNTVYSGSCREVNQADPGICDDGTIYHPWLSNFYGTIAGVKPTVSEPIDFMTNVFEGEAESIPLTAGVDVGLPNHGSGNIALSIIGRQAPSRYKAVPGNTAYRIATAIGLMNQSATISLPYESGTLSAAQLEQFVVLQATVTNPGPEDFLPIPSQKSGGKIIGTTNLLASSEGVEFMAAVPIHENAHVVENVNLAFQSNRTDIQVVASNITEFALRKVLAILSGRGLHPVTPVYHVGPDGAEFPEPAVITMKFDDSQLAVKGVARSTLRILQFNGDGTVVRMPGQSVGSSRVSARVPFLTSHFAIFGEGAAVFEDLSPPQTTLSFEGGSGAGPGGTILLDAGAIVRLSAADPVAPQFSTSGVSQTYYLLDQAFIDVTETPGEVYTSTFSLSTGAHSLAYYSVDGAGNTEPVSYASLLVSLPDGLPPRTAFVIGPPSTSVAGADYVSGSTPLGFTVIDDKYELGDGLGAGATQTFYTIDGGTAALFSSSFTMVVEGTRTLSFFSVDLAGNSEAPLERTVLADLTPPVSLLTQNAAEISLEAFDPNGSGVNSGVARIRYLVDYGNPDVCNNVPEDLGFEAGTCENPWYAGPFTLPSGEHPITFQAFDAVGNVEAVRTTLVTVESGGGGDGGGAGGLGIGKDPSDEFWSVFAGDGAVSFAHSDSSGALISSTSLQDAGDGLPWSVFFNTAGRAYAIGMANDPATQALDLAIYQASPSGDAIESRTLFDSGYASNELVFDAKSPGWIAGAAQTAGPADFEAEGERSFALALWRFDPALGTVQLSTSTTRAGFDFGSGLAVDADGSLWVVGYSLRPDAPDLGALDLALRHYAADGQTLLGGPYFLPGYLDHFDGPVNAKVHVTADAVYAAAPRRNGSDGFDMAFLKFDKATGAALVEKIWRAGDGAPSYPVAVLPEAAGLLIVGGIGAVATEAVLWRFGYDGSFLSAATADAGGAQGAVFKGTELWLSVDGSTVPYRVMSEAPAAGNVIDISTPAGPAGFAVNPATGPIGIPFTIAGAGFGPYAGGNTRVKFGTLIAALSLWNDTTIKGTIPGQSTGTYAVAIERQNASSVTAVSAGDFIVTDLNTAVLNVSSGPIGVPFTIAGTGFGLYAGALSRVLVDGATAPLSVWNDTTISGTIPGVAPGAKTVVIQRAAGAFLSTSDGFAFEVTVPSVTAVSPSSAPIGAVYTLTGFSFGPYAGANTRVLIGGATTALSLWSDRVIKGTVPGVLSPGVRTVIVERRTADGGLVQSGTAYFQVAGLMVSSLAPSSGPIGIPFTISGAGFGAFDGANTRVRFGVSTAALSLWNDTTIAGTIPALEAGDWSVTVERQQGASVASVSAGTFTATAPNVEGIAPASGPIGAPFTITGSQFGVYGGANTRVKFNGVVAPLSLWNDTTITGTVPALSTGAVDVVVERQQGADVSSSMVASFTVVELAPGGMTPETGPIGTVFTITGTGFGPYAGANTRVLIGGATAALSLWNDTTITGTIPALPAGAQPLWIERSAGTGVQSSATAYFEVTVPAVSSLSPSSAPIGAPFTITGTSFGAFGGANTRVLFDGVSAALSLWNDTTITGTVPALPSGEVSVIVERLHGGGSVESGSVTFTVLAPSADPVAPASGPIGTVFTITGSGFGPYAGANTRVLIGGTTAALSLWNDTTIKGTIPSLAPGAQAVWLERSAGSGVASSATSYFNVTTPEVASLTPSSAPIGAPFTITGTSFGAYAGANTRVTFDGVIAPLSVWNDTEIKGTVPGSLAPGEATLVVERAAGAGLAVSATQAFFVLAPAISTISPSYGPVGTVVTVNGSGFGPYSGSLTKLLVGGATVPLSVWNDTTIRWTVPASLGDGEYPVVVERSPAGGTVASASATFTVGTGYSGASFGFTETLSLAATPDTYFEGDMSLSSAAGGRIDTPAKAAVEIPPNAMEEDTAITLKRIRSDGLRAAAAEEIKMRPAGEPIEFGPEGTRFATPVTIELPYDPALAGDEDEIAIHYYNPLRREWEALASVVDRARKVVTAKTDHFSIYQPLGLAPTTVAQDEFYYRDSYAFPNPSRGGAAVTFRIQPGLAETIELRVYDLSGRRIHSSSDFTFLGAIDDGNGKGAQNTYDHAWNVSGVGSGVYNYVIKASQRGHKPITKNGKVGVIR